MADYQAAYDAALAAWRQSCQHPEKSYETPVQDGCAGCVAYLAACETFTAALRAASAADEADGFESIGTEAHCRVCGQSFNPCDDSDLIHLMTTVPAGVTWDDYAAWQDTPEGPERYCGGRGEITGSWS